MAGISEKNLGRISLALKPATATAIRQLAFLSDKSVNVFISNYLDLLVARNQKTLDDFKAAENKARAAVKKAYENEGDYSAYELQNFIAEIFSEYGGKIDTVKIEIAEYGNGMLAVAATGNEGKPIYFECGTNKAYADEKKKEVEEIISESINRGVDDSDKGIFTAKNVDFDRNDLEEEDASN